MAIVWRLIQLAFLLILLAIVLSVLMAVKKGEAIPGGAIGSALFFVLSTITVEARIGQIRRGKALAGAPLPEGKLSAGLEPLIVSGLSMFMVMIVGVTWVLIERGPLLHAVVSGVVLFVFGVWWLKTLSLWLQREPLLEIGSEGIRYYKVGFVPWSAVGSMWEETRSHRGATYTTLKLRTTSPERSRRQGTKANPLTWWFKRRQELGIISIPLGQFNRPAEYIVRAAIAAHRDALERHPQLKRSQQSDLSTVPGSASAALKEALTLTQEIESLSRRASTLAPEQVEEGRKLEEQAKQRLERIQLLSKAHPPREGPAFLRDRKLEAMRDRERSLSENMHTLRRDHLAFVGRLEPGPEAKAKVEAAIRDFEKERKSLADELEALRAQIRARRKWREKVASMLGVLVPIALFGLWLWWRAQGR